MGLFGFGEKEQPKLDLSGVREAVGGIEDFGQAFSRAEGIGQRISPLAIGARESALADIATPESATQFFEGFQPTSLEQALADQRFSNIFPDVERSIKQNLSLSGIESSPILAQQLARARGELGVDIGTVLANLGQQRATGSLNARLGIDPFGGVISPLAQSDIGQSNVRQQALIALEEAQAQENFRQAQEEANRRSQGISSLGSLIGTGAGLALAPFTGGLSLAGGAALGGALGGTAAGLFGGSQSPVSLGDALSISKAFPGAKAPSQAAGAAKPVFGGGGGSRLNESFDFQTPRQPFSLFPNSPVTGL